MSYRMDLESIRKLPITEQKSALADLKKSFQTERELLKNKILSLEKLKKEKESIAKGLATTEKRETLAEVSLIAGSIKNIKSEIDGRNRELQFLDKALKQAEALLKVSEDEIEAKEEEKLDTLLLQLKEETEQRGKREASRRETDRQTTKKDEKNLEETLEEEGVTTRNRREQEIKLYASRRDINSAQDKPYVQQTTFGTDRVEQSRREYSGRQEGGSDRRSDYETRIQSGQDNSEYLSKRQQEQNLSDSQRQFQQTEEFIKERALRHDRRSEYER